MPGAPRAYGDRDSIARVIAIRNPTPERIPGGRASGRPPIYVDPWQIAQGIRVELEHTNDPRVAYEIALDHLHEIPDYYTRLAQMERAAGLGGLSPRAKVIGAGALTLLGALVAFGIALIERRAA